MNFEAQTPQLESNEDVNKDLMDLENNLDWLKNHNLESTVENIKDNIDMLSEYDLDEDVFDEIQTIKTNFNSLLSKNNIQTAISSLDAELWEILGDLAMADVFKWENKLNKTSKENIKKDQNRLTIRKDKKLSRIVDILITKWDLGKQLAPKWKLRLNDDQMTALYSIKDALNWKSNENDFLEWLAKLIGNKNKAYAANKEWQNDINSHLWEFDIEPDMFQNTLKALRKEFDTVTFWEEFRSNADKVTSWIKRKIGDKSLADKINQNKFWEW